MEHEFSRTELLLGTGNLEMLHKAKVAVFGIGGVGGYVVEALARSGIGALVLVDNDTVSPSNINRQIIAAKSTIGKYKVDVMKERVLDIYPACQVEVHKCFYLPDSDEEFDFSAYDYVVDAVDTVACKIELVLKAEEAKVPVISCMGAGNKLNPALFQVTDIYKTSVCPLAKVMRHELKKRGVRNLKVVYSTEPPLTPMEPLEADCVENQETKETTRRKTPGSVAFVPSVAGLILASEVIKDLCK